MSDPILSAFIGAVVSLVGTLGTLLIYRQKRDDELRRDLFSRIDSLAFERRSQERAGLATMRLYADPLRHALDRLERRITELRESDRAVFFRRDAPDTAYMRYKYLSTIYRLAAVLGWIRAYRRERALLDPSADFDDDIETGIDSLQYHLADGRHVERERLNRLLPLMVHVSKDSISAEKLADVTIKLENVLHHEVSGLSHKDPTKLSADQQDSLCESIVTLFENEFSVSIPKDLVASRSREICALLGIKEAWLYRDWQSGIGDLMIVDVENAPRRFDVIGFRDFERLWAEAQDERSPDRDWVARLEAPFADVDMRREDVFDARRNQILGMEKHLRALREAIVSRRAAMRTATAVPQLQAEAVTEIDGAF